MAHLYKSSFRFTTLTAFSKDDYRKAKHIITHIIENPESVEFRDPVPWEGSHCTTQLLVSSTILP